MSVLDYSKWLKFDYKKNLEGKEALAAVKQDAWDLQYVINQTDEICLVAVKRNGRALKYVHTQTEEICLAAVEQDAYALRIVEERIFNKGKVKVECNGKTVYISRDSAESLGLGE